LIKKSKIQTALIGVGELTRKKLKVGFYTGTGAFHICLPRIFIGREGFARSYSILDPALMLHVQWLKKYGG